jgi:hypothetical protein
MRDVAVVNQSDACRRAHHDARKTWWREASDVEGRLGEACAQLAREKGAACRTGMFAVIGRKADEQESGNAQ